MAMILDSNDSRKRHGRDEDELSNLYRSDFRTIFDLAGTLAGIS